MDNMSDYRFEVKGRSLCKDRTDEANASDARARCWAALHFDSRSQMFLASPAKLSQLRL